jgi:hypothetical protein
MAVAQGYGKTVTSGSVFAYDVADTRNSYIGEPTTNLLPNGVAAVHDAASGNAVTVTDATSEKGPGWKKVTITARGSNFRTLQWTYLSMSANITYTFSAVFDWGNLRSKNYYMYFDGSGTGGRTYYRPGDYSNAGSELINSTMPDGKFAGKILHSDVHTHSFFIGNPTTGVSGLNDYFYYKEFQAEVNSHPTQFTTGTRSATQGLLPLVGNSTLDLSNVSFTSNGQMTFDGTDDFINTTKTATALGIYDAPYTMEAVFKVTNTLSGDNIVFGTDQTNTRQGMHNGLRNGGIYFAHYSADYSAGSVALNEMVHVLWVYDGTTAFIYKNGVLQGSGNIGSFIGTTNIQVGRSWVYFQGGEIPVAKIYNRALSAGEVRQNYLHYKTRFNLS